LAVTATLSAGACSNPPAKKADATSGVVTSLIADPTTTTGNPSTAPPSVFQPSPPATAVPSSVPPAAKAGVELRGDDLAVTRVGAPFREAVAAITGSLGPPSANPTPDTGCVGASVEAEWSGFRLAANGGKVSGWSSTRNDLKTPSGVTVGTTIAALRRVYGDRLMLEPPSPDAGTLFGVRGVNLAGGVSGSADTDHVDYLFNGECSPP